MTGLNHLLLNTVIVLFPIYMLKYKKLDPSSRMKNEFIIGVLSSISIILCMTFPFEILPGYIFGLHTIPFLIGIFYGGYIGGGLSTLSLYLYRLYLGGPGMWNIGIVYSIVLVLAYLIIPLYMGVTRERKKWICTGLALLTATLMLVNTDFREGLPSREWVSTLIYFFLHGLIAWISIDRVEEIREHSKKTWDMMLRMSTGEDR